MKTSESLQPPDLLPMELPLTSSAAASRVKTSASPEKSAAWAPKHDLAYGLKSPVLLAKLDQNSSSWRTSQTCLLAQAESLADGLAEFSETWPRSGMMQSGTAFQLPTLLPTTSGQSLDCGLPQTLQHSRGGANLGGVEKPIQRGTTGKIGAACGLANGIRRQRQGNRSWGSRRDTPK